MNIFKKGDVLIGKNTSRGGAYHPIVFISGIDEAPNAVVLTHSNRYSCNIKLLNSYDKGDSYFVAHLIEKMPEWGPYKKIDAFKEEDLNLIKTHISDQTPITWAKYEDYIKNGCPEHN